MLTGWVIVAAILGFALGWAVCMAWHQPQLKAARADARTDALTGLPNRRAFDERLAAQHSQADRYGTIYSLILFDLDGFKEINDSRGHPFGDEVLCRLADRLKGLVRLADLPARFGGDEFAVICPGTALAGARTLADRLSVTLVTSTDGPERLSASFGVSTWRKGDTAEAVLSRADAALCAAKRDGRAAIRLES